MPIVRIPFIGMEHRYATRVTKDFPDFFAKLATLLRGMELVEIIPIVGGGDRAEMHDSRL